MERGEDRPGAWPLRTGKIPGDFLAQLLAELPVAPPELRLGPRVGEDACAIEIPGGVLIAATDPITLSSEEVGRLAVIVNANDVAVTGGRPRWFLSVVLVPPGTDESVVRGLFEAVQGALAEVGAVLVGGHTEVTSVVTRPVVVGQMLGLAEADGVMATGGVVAGSVIVQVGLVPVEGAALFAREAAGRLGVLDSAALAAARDAFDHPGISIVEPALLAARLGAVALHDPTEGGLAAGLHELAARLGRPPPDRPRGRALVRARRRRMSGAGRRPVGHARLGTLLAAFPAELAEQALQALAEQGHPVAAIGTAEFGSGMSDRDGRPIPWPDRDEVDRVLREPDAEPRRASRRRPA